MACVYPTYAAQIYSYTHWLPFLIPLAITVAAFGHNRYGKWGKQVMIAFFGYTISVMQIVLIIVQYSMGIMRADPYCPDTIVSLAYPCQEAYYATLLVTFIFCFVAGWNIELSWIFWAGLLGLMALPPVVLVWFQFNTPLEVGVSMAIGAATSIVFMLVYSCLILPDLPFILTQFPWVFMECIDSYSMELKDLKRTEELRAIKDDLHSMGWWFP